MTLIKLILTVLSLIHYTTQSTFWRTDFYWLFIWVIAFHLLWFYVEKPVLRGVTLGIIALLSVINTAILPQLPILLLALLVIDIRTEWPRKGAGTAIGTLGILLSLQWTYLTSWPALQTLLVFIGVLTLAWWCAEQTLIIAELFEAFKEPLKRVFKQAIENDFAFELNGKSIVKYGTIELYKWAIPTYIELGGTIFSLGSDAHNASEHFIGFADMIALLEQHGVAKVALYKNQERYMVPLKTVKTYLEISE